MRSYKVKYISEDDLDGALLEIIVEADEADITRSGALMFVVLGSLTIAFAPLIWRSVSCLPDSVS